MPEPKDVTFEDQINEKMEEVNNIARENGVDFLAFFVLGPAADDSAQVNTVTHMHMDDSSHPLLIAMIGPLIGFPQFTSSVEAQTGQ